MFDNLKKGLYWTLLIFLSFICVLITLKFIYYLFIILATLLLALMVKNLYEKR